MSHLIREKLAGLLQFVNIVNETSHSPFLRNGTELHQPEKCTNVYFKVISQKNSDITFHSILTCHCTGHGWVKTSNEDDFTDMQFNILLYSMIEHSHDFRFSVYFFFSSARAIRVVTYAGLISPNLISRYF